MRTLVRDLMTVNVAAVQRHVNVRAVADLLDARKISAVPVIDSDCHVVGVVSEADVLHHRFTNRTAGAIMSTPPVTVLAGQSADVAARCMEQQRVKRLPVVDDKGRLIGIVSRCDLVHAYSHGLLPDMAN